MADVPDHQPVAPLFTQAPVRSPIIEMSGTDRGRCPVCGDPHGDCKGDSEFSHMVEFLPPKKHDPEATFIVGERIYITREIGSKTIKTLLYSVGDRIRPEEAARLGLIR